MRRREVESDENDEESILQSLPSKSKRRQFSSLCSLPRSSGYLSRGGMLRSFGLEQRRAEWSRRGEEAEGVLLQKNEKRKKKRKVWALFRASSIFSFFSSSTSTEAEKKLIFTMAPPELLKENKVSDAAFFTPRG